MPAAMLLGTPLLAGGILLLLALFDQRSVPYRDRATMIPVAIALLLFGAGGGTAYLKWRSQRKRQNRLSAKAQAGALVLRPDEDSPRLVEISFALAGELFLPPGSCELPEGAGRTTAGRIAGSVAASIGRLEDQHLMLITPDAVRSASALVSPYAGRGQQLRIGTRLKDVVANGRERELWKEARKATGYLPSLTLPKWGGAAAGFLAVALTFGITVPLAIWLDQTHPIHDPSPAFSVIARIVVRGGFFAILILGVIGIGLLIRRLFPTFPPDCQTVGQLAGYLNMASDNQDTERWDAESVWQEVRLIIAKAIDVPESQVHATTDCR